MLRESRRESGCAGEVADCGVEVVREEGAFGAQQAEGEGLRREVDGGRGRGEAAVEVRRG